MNSNNKKHNKVYLSNKKKEKIKVKSRKYSEGLILGIISILVSGIVGLAGIYAGLYTYDLDKKDTKHNLCLQETKSFNIKNYDSKDLSVLIKECKQEVLDYNLLGELLYSNNLDEQNLLKFTSIVNEFYFKGLLQLDDIVKFSHKSLMEKISNPIYKYKAHTYEKNILPEVKNEISKFLLFTSNINFKTYNEKQINDYFSVFFRLIFYGDVLEKKTLPKFIHFIPQQKDSLMSDKFAVETKNFLLFKNLMGKVSKNGKTYLLEMKTKDVFESSIVLYNSYLKHNNKKELIQLHAYLLKQIKVPKYDNYLHKMFIYNMISLLHNEFSTYKLNLDEQSEIFNNYANYKITASAFLFDFQIFIMDILFYDLFIEKNKSLTSDFLDSMFTEIDHLLQFFHSEFINYIGIKQNPELLFKLYNKYADTHLGDDIFDAILLHYTYNKPILITNKESGKILSIIYAIKEINSQNFYFRNALSLKSHYIHKESIKFIYANKQYYLNRLNDPEQPINFFELYTIFAQLLRIDPSSLFVKDTKELRVEKINLCLDFLKDITYSRNKIKMYESLIKFVKADFELKLLEKIRVLINHEDDEDIKKRLLKAINEKLTGK